VDNGSEQGSESEAAVDSESLPLQPFRGKLGGGPL
jgi:hypothetical protein